LTSTFGVSQIRSSLTSLHIGVARYQTSDDRKQPGSKTRKQEGNVSDTFVSGPGNTCVEVERNVEEKQISEENLFLWKIAKAGQDECLSSVETHPDSVMKQQFLPNDPQSAAGFCRNERACCLVADGTGFDRQGVTSTHAAPAQW
jgi:hypothetical protein